MGYVRVVPALIFAVLLLPTPAGCADLVGFDGYQEAPSSADSSSSAGGMGGAGGGSTAITSTSTTTASSASSSTTSGVGGMGGTGGAGGAGGAGGNEGEVPCAPGPCTLPDICCHHSAMTSCDKCRPSGQCQEADACTLSGNYSELKCNDPTDCGQGEVCCISISNNTPASSCAAACPFPSFEACTAASPCVNGGACTQTSVPGYSLCL